MYEERSNPRISARVFIYIKLRDRKIIEVNALPKTVPNRCMTDSLVTSFCLLPFSPVLFQLNKLFLFHRRRNIHKIAWCHLLQDFSKNLIIPIYILSTGADVSDFSWVCSTDMWTFILNECGQYFPCSDNTQIPCHRNDGVTFLHPFTAPLNRFTTLNKTF